MIEFPFIGPSHPGSDEITLSSMRTVNMYPETDGKYKNPNVLLGFPGHQEFHDFGVGPVRAMKIFNNELIVVTGNEVHKLGSGFGASFIGYINTSTGSVSIAENGVQCVIVDGSEGWVLTTSGAFNAIGDGVFNATKTKTISALDGMFFAVKEGTREFFVSEPYDPQSWPALKTASAEFKGGTVNATWSDRELFIFTNTFTQVYYNSGASPMPWVPIRNGRLLYGLAAKSSLAIVDNTTYFLARGEDGALFIGRINGYTIDRVSSRAWEREWDSYPTVADAFAFSVQWRGHEWYMITFPSALNGRGKSFIFDAEHSALYEVGNYFDYLGDFGRHDALAHSYFLGKHLIGDVEGKIFEMRSDVYTFDGSPLISLRRAPVLHAARERVFMNKLQVDMEVGNGGTVMLDISDDGGRTFDNRRYKGMGTAGVYDSRVIFRQLGSSFDRVFQVSVSDAVNRKFLGAYLE